jgi:hypothetical protein
MRGGEERGGGEKMWGVAIAEWRSLTLPFACSAELMSDIIPANTGQDAEVPDTGLATPPERQLQDERKSAHAH